MIVEKTQHIGNLMLGILLLNYQSLTNHSSHKSKKLWRCKNTAYIYTNKHTHKQKIMRHFATKKEAVEFKNTENKKLGFPSMLIFKKIKGMKNIKYLLLVLFLMLSHFFVSAQDYEIIYYEETTKKDTLSIAISGSVYITPDSIAMYLYEPLMLRVVLYGLSEKDGVYTGYMIGKRRPVTFRIEDNIIFVNFWKLKAKLYVI